MDTKTKEKEVKVDLPLLKKDESTVKLLLGAGVHFGHQTQRWNPAMKKYIYTSRDGIHIIDLLQSIDGLNEAVEAIYEYARKGEILFVGTKTQAQDVIRDAATRSKSHFIINRWPGGFLTNYLAMRKSIKKINDLIKSFKEGIENRTKNEMMQIKKELERLEFLYGGVKNFNKRPSCVVVVDSKRSRIVIKEAQKMSIPVIAIVDTNSSPEGVKHVIPANDDAIKSIEFIINKLADIVLIGNGGKGVEYAPVDFTEIEDNIQNMARIIAEKKMSRSTHDPKAGDHMIFRVSREQAKKFTMK